jgi:hypothetical protein
VNNVATTYILFILLVVALLTVPTVVLVVGWMIILVTIGVVLIHETRKTQIALAECNKRARKTNGKPRVKKAE